MKNQRRERERAHAPQSFMPLSKSNVKGYSGSSVSDRFDPTCFLLGLGRSNYGPSIATNILE